jgi:hypothetical protein
VVGGSFIHDALEDSGRLVIPSQSSIQFSQAEIDKEKFLLLIPVLIDGRICVCAADTPVATGYYFQKFHPLDCVAHDRRIGDDSKVDNRQQGAVDIILHPWFERSMQLSTPDECGVEPFLQ